MFNTQDSYGFVARFLHWAMAIAIIAMFALGLWMRELDYYSPYYQIAPNLHKSFGIVLFGILALRFVWRLFNPEPNAADLTPLERRASKIVHWGFYPLLFALMIAGYFISTLDGRAISVFGLFDVPSIVTRKGMESIAGQVHYYLAFVTIGIASFHALAALYHHFRKRDGILMRMLTGNPRPQTD